MILNFINTRPHQLYCNFYRVSMLLLKCDPKIMFYNDWLTGLGTANVSPAGIHGIKIITVIITGSNIGLLKRCCVSVGFQVRKLSM